MLLLTWSSRDFTWSCKKSRQSRVKDPNFDDRVRPRVTKHHASNKVIEQNRRRFCCVLESYTNVSWLDTVHDDGGWGGGGGGGRVFLGEGAGGGGWGGGGGGGGGGNLLVSIRERSRWHRLYVGIKLTQGSPDRIFTNENFLSRMDSWLIGSPNFEISMSALVQNPAVSFRR